MTSEAFRKISLAKKSKFPLSWEDEPEFSLEIHYEKDGSTKATIKSLKHAVYMGVERMKGEIPPHEIE